jgi:hypothetical protein
MSVKLTKPIYPLGFSDLLPEGICGLLPNSTPPVLTLPKLKVKVLKSKKKALKGIHKIKPISFGQPIIVHTSPPVSLIPPPLSKKTGSTKKKKKRLFSSESKSISEMSINYDKIEVPDYLSGLETSNTIEVSETLLHKIARVTEIRTKQLGKLLLANTAPSILAHVASINYVSAVMQDSFDIEFEEDPSIGEAIRDITKIEVLEFFTRKLKVPEHRKEAIMSAFVDKLTTCTVARMEILMRQGHNENKVKELEAVLTSRARGSESVVVRGKSNKDHNTNQQQERVLQRPMIPVPPRQSRQSSRI